MKELSIEELAIELKKVNLELAMLRYNRMAELENELYPVAPVFATTSITKYRSAPATWDAETEARERNQSLLTAQF